MEADCVAFGEEGGGKVAFGEERQWWSGRGAESEWWWWVGLIMQVFFLRFDAVHTCNSR